MKWLSKTICICGASLLLLAGCTGVEEKDHRVWDGTESEHGKVLTEYSKDVFVEAPTLTDYQMLDELAFDVLDAGVQDGTLFADLLMDTSVVDAQMASRFAQEYEKLLLAETQAALPAQLRVFGSVPLYEDGTPHYVYSEGTLYDQQLDGANVHDILIESDELVCGETEEHTRCMPEPIEPSDVLMP